MTLQHKKSQPVQDNRRALLKNMAVPVVSISLVLSLILTIAVPYSAAAKDDKNKGLGKGYLGTTYHPYDKNWDSGTHPREMNWQSREQRRVDTWHPDTVRFNNQNTIVFRNLMQGRRNYGLSSQQIWALRHQSSLPPGIQKNFMRGKALPPGIARQSTMLPNSFLSNLGWPTNRNLGVGVYGNQPYVYNRSNNIILDILNNVL